ncbi:hypothetical protein [Undibacter mobilis]|uniref:Uncharacterized protein n=1 Tax=Undibacter mobilis TaxID=2292256 RepID=A0A371BB36_9BRAD|nr:hypothetical protein [Undibacter mobilis]RDV04816.1 hypothetical protein DXH78_09725 [Undibacter mobilis]
MIVESLFGLSLVLSSPATINVSLNGRTDMAMAPAPLPDISMRQKESTLLPLVRRATQCIVRKVASDPRYDGNVGPATINDLIIDSIPACARPVRAMIDAHDRLYGSGSGEAFLLGPYLDVLPSAIGTQAKVRK